MVFNEFVVGIHYNENNYMSALVFSDTSLSSEWGCSVVLVSRFLNSVSGTYLTQGSSIMGKDEYTLNSVQM